jgi:hypothetical protein
MVMGKKRAGFRDSRRWMLAVLMVFVSAALPGRTAECDKSIVWAKSGHQGGVWTVAFAPNGSCVVSGGGDRTAKLWAATDGRMFRTLRHEGRWGICVAFSPDSATLALGGGFSDSLVAVWRVSEGPFARVLSSWSTEMWSLAFYPDGKLLAAAAGSGRIQVWRTSDWRLRYDPRGNGETRAVAFWPDDAVLAWKYPRRVYRAVLYAKWPWTAEGNGAIHLELDL